MSRNTDIESEYSPVDTDLDEMDTSADLTCGFYSCQVL